MDWKWAIGFAFAVVTFALVYRTGKNRYDRAQAAANKRLIGEARTALDKLHDISGSSGHRFTDAYWEAKAAIEPILSLVDKPTRKLLKAVIDQAGNPGKKKAVCAPAIAALDDHIRHEEAIGYVRRLRR